MSEKPYRHIIATPGHRQQLELRITNITDDEYILHHKVIPAGKKIRIEIKAIDPGYKDQAAIIECDDGILTVDSFTP